MRRPSIMSVFVCTGAACGYLSLPLRKATGLFPNWDNAELEGVLSITIGVALGGLLGALLVFTPRRWFKWSWLTFSLRSMFVVVTVFACWLGWELKFVRERKAWRAENEERIVALGLMSWDPYWDPYASPKRAHIPWWRMLMGDVAVEFLAFSEKASNEEFNYALRLFPEVLYVTRDVNLPDDGQEHRIYENDGQCVEPTVVWTTPYRSSE